MVFFGKKDFSDVTVKSPRDMLISVLQQASGVYSSRRKKYNIFYNIVAFWGVCEGVGTSTLVSNVALALADAGVEVLVVDTSILHPVQDVLLATGAVGSKKGVDWFDLSVVKESPLHISSLNKNISVLSFASGDRGVVDAISTKDSGKLVEMAYSLYSSKFDIILVDACHEITKVNVEALARAGKVIQVWNDAPTVLSNMESFINNAATLAISLDKMRNVVYSRLSGKVQGVGLDALLKQYRCRCVSQSYLSEELYSRILTDKSVWYSISNDVGVESYQRCVCDIVLHLLGISDIVDFEKGKVGEPSVIKGDGSLLSEGKDVEVSILEEDRGV